MDTSVKRSSAFQGQYFLIQNVHFNGKMTCIKLPTAFKTLPLCPMNDGSRHVHMPEVLHWCKVRKHTI